MGGAFLRRPYLLRIYQKFDQLDIFVAKTEMVIEAKRTCISCTGC
jgi:hypothetical protein